MRYYTAGMLLNTPGYDFGEGPESALTQKPFNLKVWIRYAT